MKNTWAAAGWLMRWKHAHTLSELWRAVSLTEPQTDRDWDSGRTRLALGYSGSCLKHYPFFQSTTEKKRWSEAARHMKILIQYNSCKTDGNNILIAYKQPNTNFIDKAVTPWTMHLLVLLDNWSKTWKRPSSEKDLGFLCGLFNFLSCSWLLQSVSQRQKQERWDMRLT